MDTLERLDRELKQKIEQTEMQICGGRANSYEHYREMVARLRSLKEIHVLLHEPERGESEETEKG